MEKINAWSYRPSEVEIVCPRCRAEYNLVNRCYLPSSINQHLNNK
jgi:hypothetical protein